MKNAIKGFLFVMLSALLLCAPVWIFVLNLTPDRSVEFKAFSIVAVSADLGLLALAVRDLWRIANK